MSLAQSALLLRETTLTGLPYSNSDTVFALVDATEFQENFDAEREFHLVIWDKNSGSPKQALDNGRLEVVNVVSNSGGSITVQRGVEGTDPITIDSNGEWLASLMLTPAVLHELDLMKVSSVDFSSIVKLTQAQYNALDPVDPEILYVIVE